MRKARLAVALCAALALCVVPAQASTPSQGNFGLYGYDVTFTDGDGASQNQAGTHPFAVTTTLGTEVDGKEVPEGRLRNLFLEQLPGLVGDTTAYPRCTSLQFLLDGGPNACPLASAVGVSANSVSIRGRWITSPVFNLTPPPGVLLRLGFTVDVQQVIVDAVLDTEAPNNAIAATRNTPQQLDFFANSTQLWGNPSDDAHNGLRGPCGSSLFAAELPPGDLGFQFEGEGNCDVEPNPKPFLTLPTNCGEVLESHYRAFSWEGPTLLDDGFDEGSREVHDAVGNPETLGGCGSLPSFSPEVSARPTSHAAQSPTGLDLEIAVEDEGLTSVGGRSQSRIRDVRITLPEGMTANPSVAEGLEVCSEADLDRETLSSPPGEGCPQASKIGTVEVQTPLVDRPLNGSLYQAEPYKNRFGALIALFIVVKSPELGILVKQATRVEPDPVTGQLVGIAEDIPPTAAFSSFRLHFREGGRSPLVSPKSCGAHIVKAQFTPWAGTADRLDTSSFELVSGPNEGPCPADGTPPFEPGFQAGSLNNAAGRYSTFAMRLTRRDGDRDLSRFDATLPPGVLARLAGVSRCSNAQIARAKARAGLAELASPSCPLGSRIGTVRAGAGVGSQLTYVRGAVYLAGPFAGAPLSAVAIVPAVAGPFDIGTVVYRQALRLDPRTGEVSADGGASDPLPRILAGIPVPVRDVQVLIDRSTFTLNPTSCQRSATRASIWGEATPVQILSPYQASSCASLGFAPRLDLRLKGGTRRGAHPALRSVYKPKSGDANLEGLVLRFPRSVFLDQGHIRTICTRVQFAADSCPKGAVYGRARVFTPLLDEPLEGPLYLRSSNHNLPDAVLDLHGLVDVEASARVDSKRGGLRVTFNDIPDAPITKAVVRMQGAQKGLIVNSTNLCTEKHRAHAKLEAQNGKRSTIRPVVRASC